MPWGDWINELPTAFFMVVHIAAFALGATFAWAAFKRELNLLGTAFSLFAAAELTYMPYHLDWTVSSSRTAREPARPRQRRAAALDPRLSRRTADPRRTPAARAA